MANKIGRFEILSEITHSEIGAVYKAADPESGQTIALKTIKLQMLAEQADTLMQYILQEAAGTKPLSSHNIAQLFGVEEIDGQCCAAEEYVQGNSIATMLARKEGFSIWDLQDIVRQTCQGLDHAHSHNVVHYSLEPAKIMVTWDGTVKVLSFGVSCMGAFTCQASGKAPDVLHYVSPEQLRGDPVDGRSNIFSLGAILYEMATENKAFPGDDADQVRQAIVEVMPAAPDRGQPQDPSRTERSHHEGAVQGARRALSERTGTGQRSGALQGKRDQGGRQETGASLPGIEAAAGTKAAAARRTSAAEGIALAGTRPGVCRQRGECVRQSAEVRSSPSPARAAAAAAGWESASAVSTVASGESAEGAPVKPGESVRTKQFSGAGQRRRRCGGACDRDALVPG